MISLYYFLLLALVLLTYDLELVQVWPQ